MNKIKEILGNDTIIKLDLHHCNSRITKTIKKALKGREKSDFIKDIMLMTRNDYDWASERTQPTANPDQILNAIDAIIRYGNSGYGSL